MLLKFKQSLDIYYLLWAVLTRRPSPWLIRYSHYSRGPIACLRSVTGSYD